MSDSNNALTNLVLFVVGVVLGILLCLGYSYKAWEKESVKMGFAEYNSQTGEWQWKPVIKESAK